MSQNNTHILYVGVDFTKLSLQLHLADRFYALINDPKGYTQPLKRLSPQEYDCVAYRCRNEIERLFRRLKSYRRVFCRFGKLDILSMGFIALTLIVQALRFSVNRP